MRGESRLFLVSPDHSVRSRQHIWWDREADLLGGFEIDDQLELGGLLDGKIGWLRAFEYPVNIYGGAPKQVGGVRAVVHKAAGFRKFGLRVNRWEPALQREVCKLCSL